MRSACSATRGLAPSHSKFLSSGQPPRVAARCASTRPHLPGVENQGVNFDVRNLSVKGSRQTAGATPGSGAGPAASILSSAKACAWISALLSAQRCGSHDPSETIDDLKSATQAILREAFHHQKDEFDNVDRMRMEIAGRLQDLNPIELGHLRDILMDNHFSTKMYHTTIDERALKYGSVPLNCVPVTPYASSFGSKDFFELLQELSQQHWQPRSEIGAGEAPRRPD